MSVSGHHRQCDITAFVENIRHILLALVISDKCHHAGAGNGTVEVLAVAGDCGTG
jgi:hypothetical protein